MISYSLFNLLMPLSVIYSLILNSLVSLHLFSPPSPPSSQTCSAVSSGVAIVTGSNTGVGYATALALAGCGRTVVIACRSEEKGRKAVDDINEETGTKNAVWVERLDLNSFLSVRRFADAIKGKYDKISILVNNAGINTSGISADDLDQCFQVNYLSHFLLTDLLLPEILASGSGRVVNLSSVMHHFGSDFSSRSDWISAALPSAPNAYANSKLAAVVFTKELNRRYREEGLRSIAVNPGAVNSDIWRSFNPTLRKYILGPAFDKVYLDTRQGATASFAAATGLSFSPSVVYLQPYWLPFNKLGVGGEGEVMYKGTHPAFEMLGVHVGYASVEPRVPEGGGEGLWEASKEAVGIR